MVYFLFFLQNIVQYVQTYYYKRLFSARPSVEEEGYAGLLPSTNEVLNAPIVVSKVDASLEVTEKPVTDAEITALDDLSESKLELTETNEKCEAKEAETIEAVKPAEEKVSYIITEEAKDSEVTKTTPDVSTSVGQDTDNIKQEDCEKIESEAVKESGINNDKIELDHEVAHEVVKESEIKPTVEGIVEEIKIQMIESDRGLVPEEVSETDKKVSASIAKEDIGEHIQEFVNKLDTVLTEKSDVGALESLKCLEEQVQEVVKELGTVLNEKEHPDAAEFVKFLKHQVHDAVKELETFVTEKENLEEPVFGKESNECTQEVLADPDSIWTESPDLDAPIVETSLKESTPEETVLKSDLFFTEKEDLDGPQLEKCAKEEKFDNESNVVTDSGTSQGGLVKMSFDEDMFYSIYVNVTEAKKPMTLKDLLGIAKSASAKKPDHAAKKDEFLADEFSDSGTSQGGSLKMIFDEDLFYSIYVNVTETKKPTTLKDLLAIAKSQSTKKTDLVSDKKGNPMSQPKLFEDGKIGRKKVKGIRSWLPFISCFSINAVDQKVMPIR